nr:hypothetical protein [uncultured Flavobacterium sp.]
MKTKVLLFLLYFNSCFSQAFITLDNDTQDFIEDVNYSLFFNKKLVFKSVTKNKEITKIPSEIEYDSITLSKIDFQTIGLPKNNIDSILYLRKKATYLDEVVVSAKKENLIILGETNRFVKKQSRPIVKELEYGILLKNENPQKVSIDKIVFYTDKIYHKTAYKINFYNVAETLPKNGNQFITFRDLVYSTDSLIINKNASSKNEIFFETELFLEPSATLFVTIELLDYYDESDTIINPTIENSTKLKFQMSTKENYYSRMSDFFTKKLSDNLFNINVLINYDYANQFFKKPHKSMLVTPAILLYGKKIKD